MRILILPEEITIADFVLSTHEHVDHCHYESLLPIYQNTKAKFVGGPSSVAKFKEWGFVEERIVLLAAYERYHRGQIEFIALPNKDCVDPGAVSYLILTQGITLFEGGDSLYFEGFKEIGHKWGVRHSLAEFLQESARYRYGSYDDSGSGCSGRTRSACKDLNPQALEHLERTRG